MCLRVSFLATVHYSIIFFFLKLLKDTNDLFSVGMIEFDQGLLAESFIELMVARVIRLLLFLVFLNLGLILLVLFLL